MKAPKFKTYKAKDGFRWRLVATNGRIIAESGEAYTRKTEALKAVARVRVAVPLASDDGVV